MAKEATSDLKNHKTLVAGKKRDLTTVEAVYRSKLDIIERQNQNKEEKIREQKTQLQSVLTKIQQLTDELNLHRGFKPIVDIELRTKTVEDLNLVSEGIKQCEWEINLQRKQLNFYTSNETIS